MRRILLRVLAALARRLQRFVESAHPGEYEEDPDLVALWRPLVGMARTRNEAYHEWARRLFLAQDVDGVPRVLWDVSDGCAIRWLWEHHLRPLAAAGAARRPLVIDLGAHDAFLGSMSLNLIQLGWSAVLVEPREDVLERARRNVGEHAREGQAVVFGPFAVSDRDGTALFEPEVARDIASMEGHLTDRPSPTTRTVDLVSVDRLLARADVAPLLADADLVFLSLDIEGGEVPVLRRFLEQGVRPDVVAVEHLRTDGAHDRLLADHGYRRLARIRFNDLYARVGAT